MELGKKLNCKTIFIDYNYKEKKPKYFNYKINKPEEIKNMYDLDESIVKQVLSLNTKIFADGANFENMINLNSQSYIQGLTTNPTLMKKSGVTDYEKFAKEVL